MRSAVGRLVARLQRLRRRQRGPNGAPHTAPNPASRVQTVRSLLDSMSVHEVAAIHTHLVEHEMSADNHYFNPARPRQHLQKYVEAGPDVMNGEFLRNRSILEFGSGTRNHRSLGALLMANGARTVTCYEPGPVRQRQSALALDQLLLEVIRTPEGFSLDGGDPDEVAESAIRLLRDGGPISVGSADDLEHDGSTFDVIISNHVLEHVADLDREIELLGSLSHADTVQLHRVDFRDHRLFASRARDRSPVEFYGDGVLTTCNGLRASAVETAFRSAGWAPERRAEQRISPSDLPEVRAELFRQYDEDDLCVLTADWLARRA
jgi:Methyltransferase domain